MKQSEVIDLFAEIKEEYAIFDDSDENVARHLRYLDDFPFEAALQNVREHIKTSRFPPQIADIRGRLGDQMESQRDKELAASYHAQMDLWHKNAAPPPNGMRERVFAMLRGDES